MQSEREKLILKIEEMGDDSGRIYEFILDDRKRIVEPLLRVRGDLSQRYLNEGIEESLKNAGVE